jgi:hypothetical protein
MKTTKYVLALSLFAILATGAIRAQGTVNFNTPWIDNGVGYFGLNYIDGLSFRVSDASQPGASLAIIGASLPGHPSNSTPHLEPSSTLVPAFLIFANTNAASRGQSFLDGAPFGLVSVDLADPVAPSLSPVSITFNGFHADNSMIAQTFTVGGGGSTAFQTFLFNSEFASGLVRVEIPSPTWAMDNLAYTVPEPSTISLVALGLAGFLWRKRGPREMRANHPSKTRRQRKLS